MIGQWLFSAFVPAYSGLTAPDSHRFPYRPNDDTGINCSDTITRSLFLIKLLFSESDMEEKTLYFISSFCFILVPGDKTVQEK
jgi:hypothetical protein